MAEANLLVQSADNVATDWGGVGFLQADWELLPGTPPHLHRGGPAPELREQLWAWASVSWFFFTYCEARST
jgi:hypothetical protein